MEEIPRPEPPLLTLDEQQALARDDEERLLAGFRVVQGDLALLQDGDVDPDLPELDRRVAVLVLERAPRTSRLREPLLGVADADDEPAVRDRREPRSEVLETSFGGHGTMTTCT
jgi:hypothetical protein